MKVMTLPQVIWEIKKHDPRTDLNANMLMKLIRDNKLPHGNNGNRVIVEMRMLISILNEMLGFTGETFIPQIRTVRNAAVELRYSEEHEGVCEDSLRRYIADGKLKTIKIGNRSYIAMQSFTEPYSEKLIYGRTDALAERDRIRRDMRKQMDNLISSSSGVPKVVRKRNKQ